jgi:hypothetical protein
MVERRTVIVCLLVVVCAMVVSVVVMSMVHVRVDAPAGGSVAAEVFKDDARDFVVESRQRLAVVDKIIKERRSGNGS